MPLVLSRILTKMEYQGHMLLPVLDQMPNKVDYWDNLLLFVFGQVSGTVGYLGHLLLLGPFHAASARLNTRLRWAVGAISYFLCWVRCLMWYASSCYLRTE